ncbi:hypothetical protein ATANTOWER_001280 [Ataeniobius toweri]|uniref:Uncharacterized protein n=1 Tax=Ataeniobius toweri TaxID=208326 RepID=A0ABU7CDW1_9TELE|nr:hypothetical protein [Ataeniobius toweri]
MCLLVLNCDYFIVGAGGAREVGLQPTTMTRQSLTMTITKHNPPGWASCITRYILFIYKMFANEPPNWTPLRHSVLLPGLRVSSLMISLNPLVGKKLIFVTFTNNQ